MRSIKDTGQSSLSVLRRRVLRMYALDRISDHDKAQTLRAIDILDQQLERVVEHDAEGNKL